MMAQKLKFSSPSKIALEKLRRVILFDIMDLVPPWTVKCFGKIRRTLHGTHILVMVNSFLEWKRYEI